MEMESKLEAEAEEKPFGKDIGSGRTEKLPSRARRRGRRRRRPRRRRARHGPERGSLHNGPFYTAQAVGATGCHIARAFFLRTFPRLYPVKPRRAVFFCPRDESTHALAHLLAAKIRRRPAGSAGGSAFLRVARCSGNGGKPRASWRPVPRAGN
jgi:hypothetical protein